MRITKYEHSCFIIEQDNQRLVIDPGDWTLSLPALNNVTAVVITHMHGDHLDPAKLVVILAANPAAMVYGPAEALMGIEAARKVAVMPGQTETARSFTLEFVGSGRHADMSDPSIKVANIGVVVNGVFYDPGDSFDLPGKVVRMVAVPVAAPWLKVAESIAFMRAVQSQQFVATHDGVLSADGRRVHDSWLQSAADSLGAQYLDLPVGGSVDVQRF